MPLSMLANASALMNDVVESLVSSGVKKQRLNIINEITNISVIMSGIITYGLNPVSASDMSFTIC